ncbi:VCBS domain-containing protein, partial [Rhizobium sp. RAF56]|uniref:VCBS domain-containing protein n=1 Tax=Rhizobium sp. RAF56 TaxID=3233062 RepID=UPI003F9D4884
AGATDVDHFTVLTVANVDGHTSGSTGVAGEYGKLTWNALSGAYSYKLDNGNPAVQALGATATATESFSFTVRDEHGATSTQTLTITIHGTNDAPIAVADTNGTDLVKEIGVKDGGNALELGDASAKGNVLTNDTDVDEGDTKTVVGVQAGDSHGVDVSGH